MGIYVNYDYPESHIVFSTTPNSSLGTYEIPYDFRVHDFRPWYNPNTFDYETIFIATCLTQCTYREYVVKYKRITNTIEMYPIDALNQNVQIITGAKILAVWDNAPSYSDFPLAGYVWGKTGGL